MIARQARPPTPKRIPERTRTAYHEAGHAVLSAAISDMPQHVSIRAQGHTLGRSGARKSARPTSLIQVILAGFATEHVLAGRRPRQLDQEVGFAIMALGDHALGAAFAGSDDQDGHRAVQAVLTMGIEGADEEIKREVDRFYEIARESVSAVWPAVEAVAKALLKHEELDRDGVDEALGEFDLYTPVIAIQRTHGLMPPAPAAAAQKTATLRPAKKTRKKSVAEPNADVRVATLLMAFGSDPKLAPVVAAFEANAKVASGGKFGSNGLKANGKLFALFTQGTLVVKLRRERVTALVAAGTGVPFDPGHGRLMKEWLTVRSTKASWFDLAKEAHDFVKGAKPPKKRASNTRRSGAVARPTGRRAMDQIRSYVEDQAHEEVTHLEKVASELVGPVRHDIWDVHCTASRWWVVTPPTNLYDQTDFKSRDVVLTFHLGLALRLMYSADREVPVSPEAAHLLPGSWRRWEQAFEAFDSGDEAETFQSVGVRLRECLVSFIGETHRDDLVPEGEAAPKGADFKAWSDLLANFLAPGEGSAKLRSYLKKNAVETWEYVNWLTHAKNAVRMDAEIGIKTVEHLLGVFTAARLRHDVRGTRCGGCGSYRVVAGVCEHCDWVDSSYRAPKVREWTKEERARRLAEPCTPSSDISTFMSPKDFARK